MAVENAALRVSPLANVSVNDALAVPVVKLVKVSDPEFVRVTFPNGGRLPLPWSLKLMTVFETLTEFPAPLALKLTVVVDAAAGETRICVSSPAARKYINVGFKAILPGGNATVLS